jgi:lipocalin
VSLAQVFTPHPDDTIGVEHSGTEGPDGPERTITGSAVPVNAANTRLNVSFFGTPTRTEPGNFWILDYAPDYSWAIIGDATGSSGTILTRDQVVSGDEYDALVARAYRLGVQGTITPTPQYPAT